MAGQAGKCFETATSHMQTDGVEYACGVLFSALLTQAMHQKASRHHRRAMSDCKNRRTRVLPAKIAATAHLLDTSGR